jgi:hypothetical protein
MNGRLALLSLLLCACAERPLGQTVGSIITFAGTGAAADGGEGGPATKAMLFTPIDVAVDADGRVWISDFNNYEIKVVDHGILTLQVGTGILGDSPDATMSSCPASDAMFNHTTNIVLHDGYLYMAAWNNSRIKRVRLSDMMLENFGGLGRRTLYTGDGGPATDAAFDLPASIAFARSGELVFLDQGNEVLRRIDAEGVVHRLAGNCVIENDSDGSACAVGDAPMACPSSDKTTLCAGANGCSGSCQPGFAGDGGPALDARIGQEPTGLSEPGGHLLYDRAGNLLFADTLNGRVRRIGPDGVIDTVVAGLDHPVGLALDDDGSLYISETFAHCVRKLDPAGTLTTVAGVCAPGKDCGPPLDNSCFSGDGDEATKALLNRPYGLAYFDGKLYIADAYNNRIRMVHLR